MRLTLLAIILVGATLAGCANNTQILTNRSGQAVNCTTTGRGIVGAPLANRQFESCIKQANAKGFQ
jgi:hypothetical protein